MAVNQVSSDIERFDEGIVPPAPGMTDDEGKDTSSSDDEEHEEHDIVCVELDEEPWNVGAFLAGGRLEPMGLAPKTVDAGATGDPGLTEANANRVVAQTTKETSDPGLSDYKGDV